MESRFFENMTAEVMNACGDYNELKLRRALQNSKVLSSDISDGSAASLVYFTKFCRLEIYLIIIHDSADFCHIFCSGIIRT